MSNDQLERLYMQLVQSILNDEELGDMTIKKLKNFLIHTTNALSDTIEADELSEEEIDRLVSRNIL